MGILNQIIEILVGGITGVAEGLGNGLSTITESIFLAGTGSEQSLSVMGTMIVVFAGISLALGLFRWVLNFLTSLGARNR